VLIACRLALAGPVPSPLAVSTLHGAASQDSWSETVQRPNATVISDVLLSLTTGALQFRLTEKLTPGNK